MSSVTERTRRLEWSQGAWSLQISELVQVERDYYRPRQRRVEGVEAIRGHLTRHGEDSLARGLAAIVSDPAHEGLGYNAVDGRWVLDRSATMLSMPAGGPDLTARLSALNAEVTMLKATVAGLTERLTVLERRVVQAGPPSSRTNTAVRSAIAAVRDPSDDLVTGRVAVAPREEPVAPTSRGAKPTPATPRLSDDEDPEKDSPSAPELPPIELPPVSDLLQCLKILFDSDQGLKSTKTKLPEAKAEIQALYASRLLDDDGQERGALVADLRAVYDLGGTLMGWTPQAIEQQYATGKLDTDASEGMNEVMNNLSGAINRVGRVHTRSAALQALAEQPIQWLRTQCRTRGFETKANGHVWLVTY